MQNKKVSINILGWNHRNIIGPTIESVVAQDYQNKEVQFMDNASTDGSAEYVRTNYPQVKLQANVQNLGYAGGHNLFFSQTSSELVMVLNPDVHLDAKFLTEAVKAFDDPKVGAVCGKMLSPGGKILDATGIVVSRARRARERAQNTPDQGQYDMAQEVFGLSGQAAIFRKEALEAVKLTIDGRTEYFDEDFFAYFEDWDLSWRLRLAGFKVWYQPTAWGYHDRKAASSPGGYLRIFSFIRHHAKLPLAVKRWNWKNHLFTIIKNDFGSSFWRDFIFIAVRELAMLVFILVFETRTLGVLPEFFRQLPRMLQKRKLILKNAKISSKEIGKWFHG